MVQEQVGHAEASDPGDAAAIEAFVQPDEDVDPQRGGDFLGEEPAQAAAMRIAAADQLAGDPAQRIGMVARIVSGCPIGLLPRDGSANGVLVPWYRA